MLEPPARRSEVVKMVDGYPLPSSPVQLRSAVCTGVTRDTRPDETSPTSALQRNNASAPHVLMTPGILLGRWGVIA